MGSQMARKGPMKAQNGPLLAEDGPGKAADGPQLVPRCLLDGPTMAPDGFKTIKNLGGNSVFGFRLHLHLR